MTQILPNIEIFHKVGRTADNRVIYQVEQDGKTKKFTIPAEKEDSFDKIQLAMEDEVKNSCTKTNSKKAQGLAIGSAVLGGFLGYFFTKNKGAIATCCATGLTAMGSAILVLTMFFKPTMSKFKDLTQNLKECDLKEYTEKD